MLTPVEVCEKLTIDEWIGLCQEVKEDFKVIDVERTEQLDPVAFIELPDHAMKVINVKPYGGF